MSMSLAGLFLVLLSQLSLPMSARSEPLYNTPVYNPETASYFEFIFVGGGTGPTGGRVWADAIQIAASRTFKGIPGRLAVVKNEQVNRFLRDTFKPEIGVWIGLAYFCSFRKLVWITGEVHPLDAYSNWHEFWNTAGSEPRQGIPDCGGDRTYWPVHYWGMADGFRWNANGTDKQMNGVFIEYLTGTE